MSFREGSLLPQEEVDQPTTPNVFTRLAAMIEDVAVVAAYFFQGVGKDGHVIGSFFVVNGLSDAAHYSIVPGEPSWVDGGRAEGVAE